MSTLVDSVQEVLRVIINQISGIEEYAIPSDESSPRPNSPYCVVNYISTQYNGLPETYNENTGSDLNQTTNENITMMLSLNFYKSGAHDSCSKIRSKLSAESSMSILTAAKLGLLGRSPSRKISTALEGEWEERSQFDVFLNSVSSESEIVTAIEKVIIGLESNFGGQTTNQPIEVS